MSTYTTTQTDNGLRIDTVLANAGVYPTRSAAAKAIGEGLVTIDSLPVKKNLKVTPDLVIECREFEDFTCEQDPSNLDLDIKYEDDDLLVISKPANLIVHVSSGVKKSSATLCDILIAKYGISGLCNCQGNEDRPGIVHRLDADTSGLMICAKSDEAGYALMDMIRQRDVDRRYVALVHGIIEEDTGKIDVPIERCRSNRTKMVVGRDADTAREAVTTFRVLERFSSSEIDAGYTLVECKLQTGRTHQIRVHMQYIKHPVVGDPVYSSYAPKAKRSSLGLTRQFLHSARLEFRHPMTKDKLAFSDSLAGDLSDALSMLDGRCVFTSPVCKDYFEILQG